MGAVPQSRVQLIEESPVRILDRALGGGLGPGRLGVLMARAGAGKTAVLCHLGLDAMLRGRKVLHVAFADAIEHVSAWYATLGDEVWAGLGVADREAARLHAASHRVIKALRREAGAAGVDEALALLERHMEFKPSLLLVDGFDWRAPGSRAELERLGAAAARLGAPIWMTAETHRVASGVGEPCEQHEGLIDVLVRLEPRGADVHLELVRAGKRAQVTPLRLELETDTLRLVPTGQTGRGGRAMPLPATAYTLLSGGAAGAEEAFGEEAERLGLAELTFTFAGRVSERHRGLVQLGEAELEQGAVSSAYLQQQMRRSYPDTPIFKKVVQSIWHQVTTAGEVFAVGEIQPDGTVRGGTGWAVELARHWDKPVWVFDQTQGGWFTWQTVERRWRACAEPPRITRTRFCGTGTRFLSESGRAAIRELYARSFAA